MNSSSTSASENFKTHIVETGRLLASLGEAYMPSVESETSSHGENPRAKRAKISRFVNDLKANVCELKHIIASSGCTEPFFPSPFGKLTPKRKHHRGLRNKHHKKRERWLAEPGTGGEPELRSGFVKPVFESRVSNTGPERTMAESVFVGDFGSRDRNCELQPRGLREPGTNRDDGLFASRGPSEDPAVDPASVLSCSSNVLSAPGKPAGVAAPFANFSSQHPVVNGMVTPASGTDNNPGQQGARPVDVGDFGPRDRKCELQPHGIGKEPGIVTGREASGLVASRGNLENLTSNELVGTERTCNFGGDSTQGSLSDSASVLSCSPTILSDLKNPTKLAMPAPPAPEQSRPVRCVESTRRCYKNRDRRVW